MVIGNGPYCVYAHINKINGKIYIGQTSLRPEDRWDSGHGYKNCCRFWNAIQKYGWKNFDHEIIASNLTANEADNFERLLIEKLNTTNPQFGYNLISGGTKNKRHSEESKEKMRKAKIGVYDGEKNPNYGKHHSEETKEKIRQSHLGKKWPSDKPHFNLGKKHSAETKQKMTNARFGNNSKRNIMVYCVEFNRLFWSCSNAGREIGSGSSSISRCCRKKRKSVGKHPETGEKLHWLYATDAITQGYITQEDLDNYIKQIKEKENE